MSGLPSLTIDPSFNGPPESGNGGYTCGLLAREIEGPAAVSLRKPPPLERELALARDGDRVLLLDGDELVAEGEPAGGAPAGEVPAPVSLDEARAAEAGAFFRDEQHHPFPTCFVCGPRREDDGMRIFPGPAPGRDLHASPWIPDSSLAGEDGAVAPEFVWAALDCPTSFPVTNDIEDPGFKPIVLARLAVRRLADVHAGAQYVVASWAIERDGRKRHAGAALYDADGEVAAYARALWIELRG